MKLYVDIAHDEAGRTRCSLYDDVGRLMRVAASFDRQAALRIVTLAGLNYLRAKRIAGEVVERRDFTKEKPMHGTCKYCGCTDAHACEVGCEWIDDEHTICSACLTKVVQEELNGLARRDMLAQGTDSVQLSLSVARLTLICQSLIGALHQKLPKRSANVCQEFVQQMLDDVFVHYPVLREVVRRDFEFATAEPANVSS